MTKKTKTSIFYRILHYLIATIVFWLHVFVVSPSLWLQGSSAAFKLNLGLWIALLVWLAYLFLVPAIKVHDWWQNFRKA